MRVGLDLQLAHGTSTGIGEYATGLADALETLGVDVVRLRARALDPWRFDRRVAWDQIGLPLAARRAQIDVLHCTSGTMPFASTPPAVVTVHDVAWLRVQGHARAYARWYFGAFALERYRRARRILVDSNFSRDELLAVARGIEPARVRVAYPGVAADLGAVVRARDDAAPFVLVVGTVERRKNLETVIRALAAAPGLRLVSAGPHTPYVRTCLDAAREAGVFERVELRGYVARAELLSLYARATVVAVPSTYEGFGYGAAQALCAGVPLVSSDAASLPEVAGDAATLVPAATVDAWAGALGAMATNPDAAEARAQNVRASSIERFGWSTTARVARDAYVGALHDG